MSITFDPKGVWRNRKLRLLQMVLIPQKKFQHTHCDSQCELCFRMSTVKGFKGDITTKKHIQHSLIQDTLQFYGLKLFDDYDIGNLKK